MKPTKPNKTGIATASDIVMTPPHIARMVLEHFKPKGIVLEPARGTGNFYNLLQKEDSGAKYPRAATSLPTPKWWTGS